MPAKVFVLIPVYNAEKFLAAAVNSVLAQTYVDWEMLILDDGSTDCSYSIAVEYSQKDHRIKTIQNMANLGMMGNWNKGITFCKSEYFIKLDADDVWHSEIIAKSLRIMETFPNVGIVFTKYLNIDEYGKLIPGTEITLPDFAKGKPFSCIPLVQMGADKMFQYEILRQGLSLIRSKVFEVIGHYALIQSADTEFYFRIGCHFKIFCLDEVCYFYRIHTQSDSAKIAAEGNRNRYLFEAKNAIIDYYYQQEKLTKQQWKHNRDQVSFSYSIYLTYQYRKEKKWIRSLFVFFHNLCIMPVKTITFYTNRLLE